MLNFVLNTLRVTTVGITLVANSAAAQEVIPLNKTAEGVAMDGFDVVAYFSERAPAKGLAEFAVEYNGATWIFSSQAHADLFRTNPSLYAPKNNGWCSYAVSEGYGAEVDFVHGWAVINNALYLNWSESVRDTFVAEKEKRVPTSEHNWPTVSTGLANGTVELFRHADDASVSISHPQQLN